MKHFIYLNTDILNSYLSQINEGLLTSYVNEVVDETLSKSTEALEPGAENSTTDVGFKPFFNIKLSENKDVVTTTNTLSQTESGRELIEKILHDNAFEQLVKYLVEKQMLKSNEVNQYEEYLSLNSSFLVKDFDYILTIYNDEFINFLADNGVDGLNLSQAVMKKKKADIIKEHKGYQRLFRMAKNMIPFSKFIVTDDYIIPITEAYLRESLNNIKFKYSSKVNILGKYTGNLDDAFNREQGSESSFDIMFKSIDETLKTFFIDVLCINPNLKIIEPIALYFE
ncbi:MAG: DUF6414 family protein [Clostridium sp.]|uniref:DUF6414 family protein n=1 Tax=Clostridium sp. TaxID=1506 RepID=UPI003F3C953C